MNINVPKEYVGTGSNVVFKIQPKVEKSERTLTVRSFLSVVTPSCTLLHNNKCIHLAWLYDLLKEHGLEPNLPMAVNLHPTQFLAFDWNPQGLQVPTSWPFVWRGINCSMTGKPNALYLKVQDLTPGVGERVLDEIFAEVLRRNPIAVLEKTLILYKNTPDNLGKYFWQKLSTRKHRQMDTIYLNSQLKHNLISQLTQFLNSSSLYDKYGVTWKRVHLFHGPPGSGKSSTVLALASRFNYNIAKLTINPDTTASNLESLVQTLPENTFLLLEDVDALFVDRRGTTKIDFSTILNLMDGITTRHGLIMFLTTNHLNRLDEAFLRPGRIDLCEEFHLPGLEELQMALNSLGPQFKTEHEEYLKRNPNISIAALQRHLFECIMMERTSIL